MAIGSGICIALGASARASEQVPAGAAGRAAYEQSFRLAYRASFIGQCSSVSAQKAAAIGIDSSTLCGCAADRLMSGKSVEQLKQSPESEAMKSAIAECFATGRATSGQP